jgi:hypothetical protein
MAPDIAESFFVFFVALAILLGFLLSASAVVTAVGWLRTRGRGQPTAFPRLIMPERYPGCLTCEAIDGMGDVRRMTMHQDREHTGGVQW